MSKLPTRGLYAGTNANALANGLFHIVDTNNISQDATGSSFKITGASLKAIFEKNLYTDNGTLSAARTVTQAGFNLGFIGGTITIGADGVGSATERFFVRQDGDGTVASEAALLIDTPASLVTARTGALTNVHFHSFDAGLNLRGDIVGTSVEAALIYEGINKTISVRKVVAEIFHDVKARIESPTIQLVTGVPTVGYVFTCTNANGTGTWSPAAALSGGTTNFVARWTSANTLGIGVITDDGVKVGIGGVVASSKFSVTSSADTNMHLIGSGAATLVKVENNGFFGIGVTPGAKFHVQHSISAQGITAYIRNIHLGTTASTKLQMDSSSANASAIIEVLGDNFTSDATLTNKVLYSAYASDAVLCSTNNNDAGIKNIVFGKYVVGSPFTEFARFIKTGLFGVAVTVPTAYVDIIGGTTANASLRLRTGVAPTLPNDGDMWQDGTNVFMRIGGVTKQLNN